MHIVDKVRIFSGNNIPDSIQLSFNEGFHDGSVGKNPPPMREMQEKWVFNPWVVKIPWGMAWQSTPVFLPGESPWTEEPGRL